jgi:hypothetical protein
VNGGSTGTSASSLSLLLECSSEEEYDGGGISKCADLRSGWSNVSSNGSSGGGDVGLSIMGLRFSIMGVCTRGTTSRAESESESVSVSVSGSREVTTTKGASSSEWVVISTSLSGAPDPSESAVEVCDLASDAAEDSTSSMCGGVEGRRPRPNSSTGGYASRTWTGSNICQLCSLISLISGKWLDCAPYLSNMPSMELLWPGSVVGGVRSPSSWIGIEPPLNDGVAPGRRSARSTTPNLTISPSTWVLLK